MITQLTTWLLADWTHLYSAFTMLLGTYALIWALVRASYERVSGAPMPRTKTVLWLDVVADMANNLPGGINRALRGTGNPPLFLPRSEPTLPAVDPSKVPPAIAPKDPT